MSDGESVFHNLLSDFKDKLEAKGRMAYRQEEMESYIQEGAWNLLKSGKITVEVLSEVMDYLDNW